MHELGIIMEVMKTVEDFAQQNGLTKIDTVVLQVGELSSVIPKYLNECYPAAVDGSFMSDTKLEIEVLPGNGLCQKCGKVFNVLENQARCPDCRSKKFDILGGREFNIKEVIAC